VGLEELEFDSVALVAPDFAVVDYDLARLQHILACLLLEALALLPCRRLLLILFVVEVLLEGEAVAFVELAGGVGELDEAREVVHAQPRPLVLARTQAHHLHLVLLLLLVAW
jgi:hypothetical protein